MDTATVWPNEIRAFELSLRADGLRLRTIQNYRSSIERFAKHVLKPVERVAVSDVQAYKAQLRERISAKSVHEEQQGLKRFFRFLKEDGELADDPTAKLAPVRFIAKPQPTYTTGEISALVASCDAKGRLGMRNKALVLTLFDTGVRAGELVSMGLPDWSTGSVSVDGKTGPRVVFLGMNARGAVDRYIRHWKIASGRLWQGKKGPLTESGVHQLIARLAARAGVEDKGVHAFRRAAAAQMKRLGMQDSDIMEVMGWRSITMLRRYTAAVAEELAQAAHRRFSPGDALGPPPYRRDSSLPRTARGGAGR